MPAATRSGGHAEPALGRREAPIRVLCPPYDFHTAAIHPVDDARREPLSALHRADGVRRLSPQ